MIGKQQIQIGASQFVTGMASSDYANDGSLGITSTRINPFTLPGVLRGTASQVDTSTNASGNMIASCEDCQLTLPENRVLMDDAGNVYSVSNSAALTKRITGGAQTYTFGTTDMVPFSGSVYISSAAKLAQVNTSAWTWTEAYKSFTNTVPHPLLVFEGLLFQGDGNLLLQMDSGGTVTTQLTLTTNEVIVSLGIDPGTGLMLIGVTTSNNPSDTIQKRGIIYMHDGFSSKPRRKVLVEDMPMAFIAFGGNVVIGAGQCIWMWTGAGLRFLRKLSNVTLVNTDLPYKHHFAHVRNILCYVDGQKIVAFGEAVAGKQAFFPIEQTPSASSTHIQAIMPLGNNKIGFAYATNNFAVTDLSSTGGANNSVATTGTINFGRPVFVRRFRIFTTGVTTTAGIGGVFIMDENQIQYSRPGTLGKFVVPASQSPKYVFDYDFTEIKATTIQPAIQFDTQGFGLIRMIIWYDVAE